MYEGRGAGAIEKVAIIGVGAVGATAAFALVQGQTVREIILTDKDPRRAEGEVMDLQHCLPFTSHVALKAASTNEVEGCDLVVVTAGVAQKPGETRLGLVQRNVAVFETFIPMLARNNPRAHFLIVTNPVDVMTRVALALSRLPAHQVFGSGTVLDSARFRTLLSRHCAINAGQVHAYVIGEHGDSEVLVWSRAMIGPFHISEYCEHHGIAISPDDVERIDTGVRRAAYEIIERKGATHFAIGLATVRLVQALSSRQNTIYTLSRRCGGAFGLKNVCLSVPALVNRAGTQTPIEIAISESERKAFLDSAEVLDGVFSELGLSE